MANSRGVRCEIFRTALPGLQPTVRSVDTTIQRPSCEIATPSGVLGTEICWTARNGRFDTSTSVTTSASPAVRPTSPAMPCTPVLPITAHLP